MKATETVWQAFLAQERRDPDKPAILGMSGVSTYARLRGRAARLAARIAAHARPGQVIALEVDRPSAAIPVLLAAAARRCPVLPLSLRGPALHRKFVLEDAAPAVLVREMPGEAGLRVDALARAGRSPQAEGMPHAAYVIYTSGSTGRPKGVVVSHDALLSRLRALSRVPGFGPGDALLALTAPSFDIAMAELLLPLVVGGTVLDAPAEARLDPAVFAATARRLRPSVIQATPSFWRLAAAWGWTGDPEVRLWCGGEALTESLAKTLGGLGAELWNLYGPTEATIWATAARIEPGAEITLGTPLPGARAYLAAADGTPIRPDASPAEGEIVLYGEGLAEGYLRRPELTAERFRRLPTPDGERRCYLTGDRGAYNADGALRFLGRTDGQIKLRGHRIELTEIEAVAEEQAGVRQAVAVLKPARQDASGVQSEAHLVLFVVADEGRLTVRDVRRHLVERLPAAMRPAHVRFLAELPRTTAGKADRVLLAEQY